jgi:hypothetical protein
MIFVTGDVHDGAMGGVDQMWLRRHDRPSELACAVRFTAIAARHDIPVTLFLTGRCAEEAPELVRRLADDPLVEIGGHTWNGLQPVWRHGVSELSTGSFYGSRRFQERDVTMTLAALRGVTGRPVTAWRTHAFRGDATTLRVLAECGVVIASDHVEGRGRIARLGGGLISVPINTMPDHDHVAHGALTRDRVEWERAIRANPWVGFRLPVRRAGVGRACRELVKRSLGLSRRALATDYVPLDEWWRRVRRQIDERISEAGFATLLIHPACMEIADGMASLDSMFAELATLPCRPLSEARSLVAHGP